jgi:hypothetical protein
MSDSGGAQPRVRFDAGNLPISIDVKGVHQNVSQEMIIVTEDKVRLCLTNYLAKLEKRQAWLAPFGILVATVGALVTADFKMTRLGLDGPVWQAVFVMTAGLSLIWLVRCLSQLVGAVSIDDVIRDLKAETKVDPSAEMIAMMRGNELEFRRFQRENEMRKNQRRSRSDRASIPPDTSSQ